MKMQEEQRLDGKRVLRVSESDLIDLRNKKRLVGPMTTIILEY